MKTICYVTSRMYKCISQESSKSCTALCMGTTFFCNDDMIQSYIHARSVPANLGRRISERMGRLTLGPYWPASRSKCVGRVSRFKCTGQWVSILAHGLVCISIFGCSQDVRHKLTKIVQLIIRSKRVG